MGAGKTETRKALKINDKEVVHSLLKFIKYSYFKPKIILIGAIPLKRLGRGCNWNCL